MANFTKWQHKAIHTLTGNVSVSAGAGSGKTRVLVERFLTLIDEKKANAQEILAITFTRKAAREMLERVKSGMLNRLTEAQEESQRQYWQEQILLAEHAAITTIDSFCSQVVRENPVEAAMDPNFTIQDEYRIRAFEKDTTAHFIEQEIRGASPEMLQLLVLYPAGQIGDMLLRILPQLALIISEADLTQPYVFSEKDEKARQIALETAVDTLLAAQSQAGKKGKEQLEGIKAKREILHNWIATGDYEKAAMLLKQVGAFGKIKELVMACREASDYLLRCALAKKAIPQVRAWQGVLTRYHTYLEMEQRNQEIYSFATISQRAVEVLATYPQILERYQKRYKYLMVDEFQDTNEEQKSLVYLLSGGNANRLLGHNLFIVGDAKQSIYRFRGADVSVFKKVRDAISETGGTDIVMDDNFRSAPEIITACNTLFDDLLGEDAKSDVTAQPLRPHQPSSGLPVFAVLQQGDCSTEECQAAEARYVADATKNLVAAHPELSYGQVAILLPAIHLAESYAKALLDLGIKSQVTDGKGFYDRIEIVDILNLLTVLCNTKKDWALVGFLRSPFVGFTDQQISNLLQFDKDLCLWDSLQQQLEEPFYMLGKKLDGLRKVALHLSLPELFDAIESALAIEPTLLTQNGGREKLANYRKLRSLAVGDAMNGHSSVSDFLTKLQQMRSLAARESAGQQELDPNAVQIMTIHKSKGLEFPAVLLPNLDKRDPVDSGGLVYMPGVGLGVKAEDASGQIQPTSVYRAVQLENGRLEEAEKKRQLYVAMTRAEKYLVLVHVENGGKGSSNREKWGQSLSRVFAPGTDHASEVEWVEKDVESLLGQPATSVEEGEKTELIDAAVYDRLQPISFPRKIELSATALLHYDTCPRRFYYEYLEKMPQVEPEPIGEGLYQISQTALGTYIHKVLELMESAPLQTALDLALEELEEPEKERNLFRRSGEALVQRYCQSPLYQELLPFEKEQEKQFQLQFCQKGQDQVIFTGRMDLLVHLSENTLAIVDYKTGHPPVDGEEKQGYRRQLLLYSLAAEAQYPGKKVVWAGLDFLQNDTRYLLKNREGELEKLEQLLEHLLPLETESDFPVRTEACPYCPFAYFCPKK